MPLTELKKWSTTIYMPKAVADLAQVPAASATIDVYKRGATVSVASGSIAGSGGPATVSVYDIGRLIAGEQVQVGVTGTKILVVTAINSATSINVRNDTASAFGLDQFDRLVDISNQPTLYRDVTGTAALGGPSINTDANGFVEFYTTERYFDYIVSKTGLTTTLYRDEESGQSRSRQMVFNILDFPGTAVASATQVNVTAALAAIPSGATLFFPAGFYEPPDANGWTLTKAVKIIGAGSNVSDAGATVFRPYNSVALGGAPNSRVFKVAGGVENVHFKHFTIFPQEAPSSTGTGDGIWFDALSANINFCHVEDVKIYYAGRDGIRAIGTNPTSYFNESTLKSVDCSICRADGFNLISHADIQMSDCRAVGNRKRGFFFDQGGGLLALGIRTNGNGADFSGVGFPLYDEAQIYLKTTHGSVLSTPDCEEFEAISVNKIGISLQNCFGITILSPRFFNGTAVANTVGIYCSDTNKATTILGGQASNLHYIVQVLTGRGNRGFFVVKPSITVSSATTPALMDIPQQNSGAATPTGGHVVVHPMDDGSGGVTIESEFLAGVELPSVNGVANIGNPALKDGWLVYDSAAVKFKGRAGGAWVDLH